MQYVDINIDYNAPFGRLETFYEQLGVFDLVRKTRAKYGIPENVLLPYNLIKCNSATHEKIKQQLIYNWQNYNYDRHSGQLKTPNIRKYKKAHKLEPDDYSRLSWHYELGISPMKDDSIPDDVLRVNVEWGEDFINQLKDQAERV